ncbi:hypothetical protein [Streptomyces sp. NPDC049040]|uniref:hypothetical protein n=1 Tax=Streptomyces sp. NPDC049040 TaxID=3365593 RepID=UPI00371CC445
MKRLAFILVGLLAFLAAFITATWAAKGYWVGWLFAAAFAYGMYRAFRKAVHITTATAERRALRR